MSAEPARTGVVVGVDDSQDAREALQWALQYAVATERPLTVVTVMEPLMLNVEWSTNPADNDELIEAARAECRDMLGKAIAQLGRPAGIETRCEVLVGHPVDKLVTAAKDAALLVVGSRGAGGFSRLMLGSVSSGVVHHASCPVTIVRHAV